MSRASVGAAHDKGLHEYFTKNDLFVSITQNDLFVSKKGRRNENSTEGKPSNTVFKFQGLYAMRLRFYQKTTLNIIFDVKQDLRRKAKLVSGGHLVDDTEYDIYSSTV
jgi:hypothetical protein